MTQTYHWDPVEEFEKSRKVSEQIAAAQAESHKYLTAWYIEGVSRAHRESRARMSWLDKIWEKLMS